MKVELVNEVKCEKGHYLPKELRRTEEVKIRFSPMEMKLIDQVMAAMETGDKLSTFLWRVVMSSICRKHEELKKVKCCPE